LLSDETDAPIFRQKMDSISYSVDFTQRKAPQIALQDESSSESGGCSLENIA